MTKFDEESPETMIRKAPKNKKQKKKEKQKRLTENNTNLREITRKLQKSTKERLRQNDKESLENMQ
ncbi:19656_t:CDS:2, partial [Gigaspora margarita]